MKNLLFFLFVSTISWGQNATRQFVSVEKSSNGFKVIVSSYFADIFKGNALNNGLLPILVSPEFLKEITTIIQENPSTNLCVNLEEQTIAVENSDLIANFEIDAYKKICMINGFDDIDFLINNKDKIEAFEKGEITEV